MKKTLLSISCLLGSLFSNAQSGDALNFDGSNDYVAISSTPLLSMTNAITIEAWVKTSSLSEKYIITKSNDSYFMGINVDGNVGRASFYINGVTSSWLYSYATNINDNNWHHIASTYDGSTVKIYIDGVLDNSVAGSGPISTGSSNVNLGCRSNGYFLQGSLDEVRIWDIARTQCEIISYKDCEIASTETGLVANYHFNQGIASGANAGVTTLADASGNAHNGAVSNFGLSSSSSNWVSPGAVTSGNVTPSVCTMASALNFDGANDIVSIPSSISANNLGLSAFTLESWVYPNSVSGAHSIIRKSGDYNLYLNNGNLCAEVWPLGTSDPTWKLFTGVAGPALNQWSHVSFTWNGTTGTLYVNGSEISSTIVNGSVPVSENLCLGASSVFGNHLNGSLDEIRIWNVTRTNCEIISYKNCEIPTTAAGLVANYHFNQGVDMMSNPLITTLTDASGNTNNGTLSNFALTGASSNWVAPGGVVSGFSTSIACPVAAALNFDGSNDYVEIGNVIPSGSSYTKEMWVYALDNGCNNLLSSGDDPFYLSSGRLAAGNNGNYNYVQDGTNFPLNTWVHAAVTYDALTSTMVLYVNGIMVASGNSAGPYSGAPSTYIGRHTGGCYFSGQLDEVRVWNVARTQCEINTYMNSEISNSTTGLLASYHFNQGISAYSNPNETTLMDASGNGFNVALSNFSLTGSTSNWVAPGGVVSGYTTTLAPPVVTVNSGAICLGQSFTMTPSGAVTYTFSNGSSIATPTADATYSVSGTDANGCMSSVDALSSVTVNICTPAAALNFDGSNDYVDLSTPANLPVGNSAYTIEAKIKPNVLSVEGIVGWGNYGNPGESNALRLDPSGNVINYWWGPDLIVSSSPINLLDGNWHHIAATFDGTTRSIYIDGILKGSDTPGSSHTVSAMNVRIGSTCTICGGEFFNGGIDEVRIWNVGRTQCELNTYKDCEIPSSSAGLVANYHFNQGFDAANNPTEINLMDASGNSNIGMLTNFGLTGNTSNWIAPGAVVSGFTTTLAPPTITVNNGAICLGQSFTMTPGGAVTYTFSNGSSIATPTADATYSVSGTDANGCMSAIDAVASVTVNALPTISVNSGAICSGQSFTMVPTGASTYTYSNGTDVVAPTADATYSVSGTDANGCVSSTDAVASVTVNALPTISVNSGVICSGQSFTMTPGGATTYTYSNGTDVATPTADATYSVSGTDANGCISSTDAISSVTVNALPVLSATTTNTLMCTGETATLSVTGASTYTWSTNETTSGIVVTPTMAITYTVDGTDANGCVNSTTILQDVNACTSIVSLSGNTTSINVYPNPNNGLFIIDLNTTSQVSITNALGQVILTETMESGKHNLDIQNQSAGIYFVKVIQQDKQHIIKLIKK